MTATAWDTAYALGRRVFYESATQTIRQCPENYCLAVRRDGRWRPDIDAASTINAHSLGQVLTQYQDGSTGDGLAEAIELAFWGELGKGRS